MSLLFNRIRRAIPMAIGSAGSAGRRVDRVFRPPTIAIAGLERRALPSSLGSPSSPPPSAGAPRDATPWTATQNIPYTTTGGQAEQLDVYVPNSPAPPGGYPVMIAIHGGAWRKLDKGEFGFRTAAGFTPYGYAVVAPNYVLAAPGKPTWPRNFQDVQATVRWVRSNAAAWHFNTDQIVAEGESAGANLAALLGVDSPRSVGGATSSAVEAVVAVSTPTDLKTLYRQKRYAGHAAAEFLGGPPDRVPANYTAASPIDHVAPGDPPMFLVHGRQDPVIPVSQSLKMQRALSRAGVPNQLALVDGGHGLDFPTHYSQLVPGIVDFLANVWKDQPSGSAPAAT